MICCVILSLSPSAINAKGGPSYDITFWDKIENLEGTTLDGAEVLIEGIVIDLENHKWSRSNFSTFKILDPETYRTVEVKLYTIKWLKRLNVFKCLDGARLKIKAKFHFDLDGDNVGELDVEERLKILKCKNEEIEVDQE